MSCDARPIKSTIVKAHPRVWAVRPTCVMRRAASSHTAPSDRGARSAIHRDLMRNWHCLRLEGASSASHTASRSGVRSENRNDLNSQPLSDPNYPACTALDVYIVYQQLGFVARWQHLPPTGPAVGCRASRLEHFRIDPISPSEMAPQTWSHIIRPLALVRLCDPTVRTLNILFQADAPEIAAVGVNFAFRGRRRGFKTTSTARKRRRKAERVTVWSPPRGAAPDAKCLQRLSQSARPA